MASLRCDFNAEDGGGTIPAAAFDVFAAGPASLTATYTVGVPLDVPGWQIRLEAVDYLPAGPSGLPMWNAPVSFK